MQKVITELSSMGRMPDQWDNNAVVNLVEVYQDLLDAIETPVTLEEAGALVLLFPEEALYGLEWTLLHIVETSFKPERDAEYRELIDTCPSSWWKHILSKRLENKLEEAVS